MLAEVKQHAWIHTPIVRMEVAFGAFLGACTRLASPYFVDSPVLAFQPSPPIVYDSRRQYLGVTR